MDEKTEQLRDIFIHVSGEESVTESQSAGRGSLTDTDEATVEERLGETVARLREHYDFRTTLDDATLVALVRGFYAGDDDESLAEELRVEASTVAEARLDLHLLRASDDDADFDVAAFRRAVVGESKASDAELADSFDIGSETAARYRRVVEARAAARGVSHRFTSEFEDALADAGLATRHTAAVRETGLDEATEDIDSLDSDADISM